MGLVKWGKGGAGGRVGAYQYDAVGAEVGLEFLLGRVLGEVADEERARRLVVVLVEVSFRWPEDVRRLAVVNAVVRLRLYLLAEERLLTCRLQRLARVLVPIQYSVTSVAVNNARVTTNIR